MKKIVITGAYSGLGYSLVKSLLNEDFKIYLTVHTQLQYQKMAEKYKDNPKVECLKVDIKTSDKNKIYALKPDILFCNAAMPLGGSLLDLSIENIQEIMDTNVIANFEIIQEVSKQMIKRNQGKIIVTTSLAGLIPIPFMGAYCSSKASLIKLVQVLRQELKLLKSNVRVKMIEPGLYHTGFNQFMFDQKYTDKSYFKKEFDYLQKTDNFVSKYLELKRFDSIVKVMKKAILDDNEKFIYHKPLWQVIPAKITQIILD